MLERAHELAQLKEAINAAHRGAGRLLLVEGPAGIGKTTFLAAAGEAARQAGMEVHTARGFELERPFAFGVVRQLFERSLARADAERLDALLAGAAGLARPLFGLSRRRDESTSPSDTPPAPDLGFTLMHGLYWLAANFAEERPLMLAIDDAHYADLSSLQFVAYLAARCAELPLLVVIALRTGEPIGDPSLLAALNAAPDEVVIELAALSDRAVTTVVRAELPDAAPEFCAACARASAGNPFLLGELLSDLQTRQIEPTPANAPLVQAASPDSVARAVLARLQRLGDQATALARAVAVLELTTVHQAAALAGLTTAAAQRAADDLVAAQILAPTPLTFVHPLLRRSVYEQIPPARLAADHGRAALLLAGARASATVVGAHLLRAPPAHEAAVVKLLRGAAAEALADGDPRTASALLRRALAEPPDADTQAAVLGELGQAEALAGDPAATDHLSQGLAVSTEPRTVVALALALCEQLVWNQGRAIEAHAILSSTIAEHDDALTPPLRALLETLRLATASVDARLVSQVDADLESLAGLADAAGPAGRALKIVESCWHAQCRPLTVDWRTTLDEGLDEGRFVANYTGGSAAVIYATIVLVLSDERQRAEALLAEVRADARTRGSLLSHLVDIGWGAVLAARLGDLPRAISDAQTALGLARNIGARWVEIWLVACLTDALREQGQLDSASALIEAVPIEAMIGTSAALHGQLARGRLRLVRGDRQGAIADLRAIGEHVIVNNPNFVPWRSALALALPPEDRDEARELVAEELQRARELGQARGIGVALRASARLSGSEEALFSLTEAIGVLRESPAQLELAYALADYGSALRRAGSRAAAREPLREALLLAQRCAADVLAQTIQEELRASGAHPRRQALAGPDALTPSERRVAELASAGLANREIAQALFVTTKTVGTHLAHIYQKLDLSGQQAREQLAERLGLDAASA